jgi:parallel beta-helix repeat protein
MKRAIPVIMLAFLSISMIILTLHIEPIKATPRTWTVDDNGPADFHTIQEAVDAANPGDVVFVYGGTYSENVVIKKPLNLVGEGSEMTVVEGGFLVSFTHNVNISGFKMIGGYDGYFGVQLCASYNNSITNNTITRARVAGIYFNYTDYPSQGGKGNNIVTLNTIWNNSNGVVAWESSDNIIHHNNFVDNHPQVSSYDSINIWDDGYPSGGNYWNDYAGIDEKNGPNQDQQGSDGIGDKPYIIDTDNLDHYPLMNLWASSKTTVKTNGEEYSIALVSNVTIDQIATTQNTLNFTVSGPSGEKGYMLVIFPAINTTAIKVFVDDQELVPPPFPVINTNGTHYFIYFEFTLSTHTLTIQFAPSPIVTATIDIDPDTLNLKSKGKWITAYIELPEGYDVNNINVSTITLNGTVPAELRPIAIGDYDNDSVPDLMAKFNRTKVSQYILSKGIIYGNVTLTLSGKLDDGTPFIGSHAIKVSDLVGDVNCDGKVDILDIVLACVSYASKDGGAHWNANANFAPSWDRIDILDIVTIIAHYRQKYP